MKRSVVLSAVAAAGAASATPAGMAAAATMTYYYVGAPARVSNVWNPEARPVINTGQVTIDRSKLPAGFELADATISYTPYGDDPPEFFDAVQWDFALGKGSEEASFRLQFDAASEVADWRFDSAVNHTFTEMTLFEVGRLGEKYYTTSEDPNASNWISDYLKGLGYAEGTAEYQSLFCGSWAGPDQHCDDLGQAAPAWNQVFRTDTGGQWFKDDPLAFARQVAINTGLAALDPPRSYFDIPPAPTPVPLPAPPALLGVALLGLRLLGGKPKPGSG